jgi:hypothetical protein
MSMQYSEHACVLEDADIVEREICSGQTGAIGE